MSWLKQAQENRAYSEKRKAAKEAGLPLPPPPNAKPKSGFPSASSTNGAAAALSGVRPNNGFKPPSVTPVALRDFSWASDAQYGPKSNGKPGFIPIRSPNGGPLCTKLSGGGQIPQTIGLKTTESYGKLRTRLNFTVDNEEERKGLDRIYRDVTAYVMNLAEKFYPGITEFDYAELVGRVLSEVKAKKTGGEWPQLASVNIDPTSLFSDDARKEPLLKILNETTGSHVLNLNDVLGQKWTSMTIEWQLLVVGFTKIKDADGNDTGKELPLISISRRLRGHLYIAVDENQFHLVLPEDRTLHDASECKRKHVKVEDITTFRFLEHARVFELKQKDQAHTAFCEHVDGGSVIIKVCGGGSIPPFCLDTNMQGKLVLTVSIDNISDETAFDALSADLQTLVLSRRDEFFKKSTHTDETLRAFCNFIMNKKTPEAEAKGFSRGFGMIFDWEKLNTTCSIIDGMGQRINDPNAIKGRKWKEIWFALRCIYVQKKSNSFEVGFSKRFVHMELQPDMESFVVNDECDPIPSLEQPNSKRPRTN